MNQFFGTQSPYPIYHSAQTFQRGREFLKSLFSTLFNFARVNCSQLPTYELSLLIGSMETQNGYQQTMMIKLEIDCMKRTGQHAVRNTSYTANKQSHSTAFLQSIDSNANLITAIDSALSLTVTYYSHCTIDD